MKDIKNTDESMYVLMQHITAFKYACKNNHWATNNYASHLLFDRLTERTDNWVDSIAEGYFMASDKKSIFKPDILNPKLIDKNLVKMCADIIDHLEDLQDHDDLNEGTLSLLGDIESDFLQKMAMAKLQ